MPFPAHRHLLITACAAVALPTLLPAPARAGSQILLDTSAPPPGLPDLTTITATYLTPTGQIGGIGFNALNSSSVLFRFDTNTGAATTIATSGEPVPAVGPAFTYFNGPFLSDSPVHTLFYASLEAPNDNGIFRVDSSGNVFTIARNGQPAPGTGGGTYGFVVSQSINATGLVTFQASTSNSGSGVFRQAGTAAATAIARNGDAAPGGGNFANFGRSTSNTAGHITFQAATTLASNSGIFRHDGSSLLAVARTGNAAPGGGTFTNSFGYPSINDAGHILFTATTTAGSGVYRADSTGLPTIAMARTGDLAPGPGGGTLSGIYDARLNSAGHAAIYAATSVAGSSVLIRSNGSGAHTLITRTGVAAPGSFGGTFSSSLGYPVINSAGAVAFTAYLSGTTGGAATDFGLFISDGTDTLEIAREGSQAIAGKTLSSLSFTPGNSVDANSTAIDDFGRVAYSASFTDGSSALFLYTPDLRWRGANGALDAPARWTLGLRPAHVHGLTISPTSDTTITGPAANLTASTLFIGNSSENVTLRLDNTGNLTVANQLTLGANANVIVPKGTLTAGHIQIFNGAGLVRNGGSIVTPSLVQNGGLYTGPLTLSPAAIARYVQTDGLIVAPAATLADGASFELNGPGMSTPTFSQTGGSFTAPSLLIDSNAVASYSLSAGDATFNSLVLGEGGTLTQTGGTLVAGTLTHKGGTAAGTLTNHGTYSYSYGAFPGKLANHGTVSLAANFAPAGGIDNFADLTVPLARTVTSAGPGITNFANLTLVGTINGTAPVTNDYGASMVARGSLAPVLVNRGSLSLTGLLTATAGFTNTGAVTLGPSHHLRIAANSSNAGRLLLAGGALSPASGAPTLTNSPGGVIQGAGSVATVLSNAGGVVHATGALTLASLSANSAGGELRVDDNASLHVNNNFPSSGTVSLRGPGALLTGGTITNTGTIQGAGRVANTIANSGRIQADGPLTLSGPSLSNAAAGTLKIASPAASLTLAQGLATNAGNLSNLGGAFSNNNLPLTNTGVISGFGHFAAGSWTNNNLITFTGGPTVVDGPLANNASRTLQIISASATFTSPLTNNGTLKLTDASAVFAGGLTGTGPSAPSSLDVDASSSALASFVDQTSLTSAGDVTLRPTSQGGSPSTLATLTLLPNSTFDLADNPLTLTSTPAAMVRGYLFSNLLTSSLATPTLTLGYLPTNSTLTIKLTPTGDANLDGVLTADDFALLDRGFATNGAYWWQGDFNYDAKVDHLDYLALDRTYLTQSPTFAPSLLSQRESQFGPTYVSALLTSIPEPALLSSILYPLSSLLFSRPRRHPRHRRHCTA